ncbi:MAG: sulfite exporter TauE/SafE family protein [Luteolibacter sp.]
MKITLIALTIGLTAGLLGAICGVGGGLVLVPAFVMALKLEHKQAVATSMAVIAVTAISATLNHARSSQLIDWKLFGMVGAAAALAAWVGSDLMRSLSNQTLTRIFGLLLIGIGLRMLLWKN